MWLNVWFLSIPSLHAPVRPKHNPWPTLVPLWMSSIPIQWVGSSQNYALDLLGHIYKTIGGIQWTTSTYHLGEYLPWMMPCLVWGQTEDEKPPLVVPTSLLPQNYHMYNFCFVFSQKPWTKASGSIHASLFMIASNEKLFVTYLPPLGYMSRLVQSNYSLYLDLVAIYTIKQKQ